MAISFRSLSRILIATTILLSFLFLRITLVFIYPILALLLFYVLGLKIGLSRFLLALAFVILGFISSWVEGLFFSNFFFSEYIILPLFLFLISDVKLRDGLRNQELFSYFMKTATAVLVVVNISAFIYAQFIVDTSVQNYEDAFTGLYGTAGFGSHSLSIINLGFSIYFLYKREYFKFLFFILCGVMGYYGLGLLVFIMAMLLVYSTRILRYWKAILTLMVAGLAMLWFINKFNARNLDYIKKNLSQAMLVLDDYDYDTEMKKAEEFKVTEIPRFIVFLDGAQKRLFGDPKVAFLGTSPGGYNSRTAFYLNGDFVQNQFLLDHFNNRTIYHQEDVFPLLNRELIRRPFNDGTRNQTFSSLVAVIMEYGIVIGLIFWVLFYRKIRRIAAMETARPKREFIRFLSIYLMLILSVQNYIEYPEIVFPFILLIKLSEVDSVNYQITTDNAA